MDSEKTILHAKKLHKSYGNVNAIQGIDFAIDQSGVVAILGQNGAGKTTLIQCALGLEKTTSGELKTLGHLPGNLSAKQQTGVILQDADLPDLLTAREQIILFASYYPNPFSVEEVIQLCNLSDFVDKRYKKLSGGQKRRVQFALAVIGDPKLIFLDEPTTGLDIEARRNLWQVIRGFAAKGKTIVLTTHYLEEADALADRIIVMNSGKIVADATPEDIHNQVRGSAVRCQTQLTEAQLRALTGVESVKIAGRFSELRCSDVNAALTALLASDPVITDLTVTQPKLEDIFTQLSQTGEAS
ncbi:MAG: ABC transporter ATP-binding protein [Aliiglaciecola sp.]